MVHFVVWGVDNGWLVQGFGFKSMAILMQQKTVEFFGVKTVWYIITMGSREKLNTVTPILVLYPSEAIVIRVCGIVQDMCTNRDVKSDV